MSIICTSMYAYCLPATNTVYMSHCTPPKTNMEPKHGGLEDDFPFQRDVPY